MRARTDDGVMIVNLWESEEGSEAMFQKPEVQQQLESMSELVQGPPERHHYEVAEYMSS